MSDQHFHNILYTLCTLPVTQVPLKFLTPHITKKSLNYCVDRRSTSIGNEVRAILHTGGYFTTHKKLHSNTFIINKYY